MLWRGAAVCITRAQNIIINISWVDIRISITSKNNKQPPTSQPPIATHHIELILAYTFQELIVVNHLSVTRKKKEKKKSKENLIYFYIYKRGRVQNKEEFFCFLFIYCIPMCREGWGKITYTHTHLFYIPYMRVCVSICVYYMILFSILG